MSDPTTTAEAVNDYASQEMTSNSARSELGKSNNQILDSKNRHHVKQQTVSTVSNVPDYLLTLGVATKGILEGNQHCQGTATSSLPHTLDDQHSNRTIFVTDITSNSTANSESNFDVRLVHEDHRYFIRPQYLLSRSHAPNENVPNNQPVRVFSAPAIRNCHECVGYLSTATVTTPPVIDGAISEEKSTLLNERYRGELSVLEKYRYDLSRAQLKASSRTSALLAGFAMVALVELQYERTTPPYLLIILGVVTTLLVSVHLLALMMSTCILPYIEANGCTQDSPHIRLKFYIDLSWVFSTCIGLMLFLIEIGVIFFVKFHAVNYITAAHITTIMLVPVVIIFTVFSCLIHKNRFIHSMNRVGTKVNDLQKFLNENDPAVTNIRNSAPSECRPPAKKDYMV